MKKIFRMVSSRTFFSAMIASACCSVSAVPAIAENHDAYGVMQSVAVKGIIVDTYGIPVIGASILEKGTTNGVITDIDGNFTLNVSSKDAVLVISYIGYKTLELKASDPSLANIVMQEDTEVLEEVDGVEVAAGNSKLMDKLGVKWIDCHQSGTIIHMAVDGRYAGHIVISDIEKPHAREAVRALKRSGVEKTVMLTGDSRKVAEHVAADLGIDEVHAELLPADKVAKVEELLARKPAKGKLAFVGDGINDAPVLSRADIGIDMGAMGSDAAIEAADIVLMDDDPLKIAKAIRISRKCLRIVYENIWFAIGVKLICLVLGAVGVANMWLAIFADVGVMIIAVLNAIRALFVKKL